ncbi:MAG: lytic transglycosylase domain-containing protein [Wenzhouxiangella sp.]|nr:MAG: lytic transglycosylase domain-containing protein [Wenzhouxiangella sp.]
MEADRCNRLDLSDLELTVADRRLLLSLALEATTGADILGRCRGPGPLSSRLHLEMKPQIDAEGGAVVFQPSGAELRLPDGGSGLFSRPSRALAEALVVPRLEGVIVDVSGLLASFDRMIEDFMPEETDPAPRLSERGRLVAVAATPDGLRAELDFVVRAPAVSPDRDRSPEPTLRPEEQLEWQRVEDELDGFLTVLIVRMAAQIDERDLQLDFLALLLETRQRIAEALVEDSPAGDPVRALFLEAWAGLRPLLARLEPMDVADDQDLRLAGFIAAGDVLTALDALGPEFGLEISREGLRRLARVLMAGEAPVSFTPLPLVEDETLRRLFGMDPDGPATGRQLPSLKWWQQILPLAYANVVPLADSLRGVVAGPANLDEYIDLVGQLLDEILAEHMADGSRIPAEHRALFDPLVRATAWRESCWRHYVGPADQPRVIRSSVGAIGMMQIMGRVWRGMYDVHRLEAELEYNIAAGIGILEHYLVDYAIRRGEHEQPGGADNLVRATYAAYNGGPSHLARYRRDNTSASLRAIDDRFWREFEQIRAEGWPPVAGCFSVPE